MYKRQDHHAHIIAVGAFFSLFGRVLDSSDTREKIRHIIRSLYIRDFLYLTDLYECFIALIVLGFWLDIWIIPKADNIVLITELEYRHRNIWSAADMDEDFWFFRKLRAIKTMLEYILRDFSRESWYDKFWIFIKKSMERSILRDTCAELRGGNLWNMGLSKKSEIFDMDYISHNIESISWDKDF